VQPAPLHPAKQPARKQKQTKLVALVPTERLQSLKEAKQRNS
jgi:hypothetical protein